MKLNYQIKVLLISVGISAFLFVIALLSGDRGVLSMIVFLSTFIVAVPQFLLRYEKYKGLKEMESKFPSFLRDMVESVRSGMPFHQAIVTSSTIDYGKLSKEIKKMANQISWGIPFDKVINQAADRLKASKRLSTQLRTIRESYISGGDVVSALESMAETAIILDEAEKERRSVLGQYVVLMYGICFLFLGIVVGINRLMVPIFQISELTTSGEFAATPADTGLINPCDETAGFGQSICGGFFFVCNVFGVNTEEIGCYYTSLFFFMSMMVAMSCGLVAGQISEGSIVAGMKHSVVMSAVIFGAFILLVRLGIMGV